MATTMSSTKRHNPEAEIAPPNEEEEGVTAPQAQRRRIGSRDGVAAVEESNNADETEEEEEFEDQAPRQQQPVRRRRSQRLQEEAAPRLEAILPQEEEEANERQQQNDENDHEEGNQLYKRLVQFFAACDTKDESVPQKEIANNKNKPSKETKTASASSTSSSASLSFLSLNIDCYFRIGSYLDPHELQDMFSCCKRLRNLYQHDGGIVPARLASVLQYYSMVKGEADVIFSRQHRDEWLDFFTWLARQLTLLVYSHLVFVPRIHRTLLAAQMIRQARFRDANPRPSQDLLEGGNGEAYPILFGDSDHSLAHQDFPRDYLQQWLELAVEACVEGDDNEDDKTLYSDNFDSFVLNGQLPVTWFLESADNCGGWPLYMAYSRDSTTGRITTYAWGPDGSLAEGEEPKNVWPTPWSAYAFGCPWQNDGWPSLVAFYCLGNYHNPVYQEIPTNAEMVSSLAFLLAHKIPPFDKQEARVQVASILNNSLSEQSDSMDDNWEAPLAYCKQVLRGEVAFANHTEYLDRKKAAVATGGK